MSEEQSRDYRTLLGKSLVALAHEVFGQDATLAQMAELASETVGIEQDEAKLIIYDAC